MERREQVINEKTREIKRILKGLIREGKTRQALILLEDNWDLLSFDIELYSIAGVIYSYQMRIREARDIILKGLKKDPGNFDLLFNIGYICELQENYFNAWNYYQKAKRNIETEEQGKDLELVIESLVNKIRERS